MADHASIAFKDVESGSPIVRPPVLWVAEAMCRRAPIVDTYLYGHTYPSVSARSSESKPEMETPREGSAPWSWRDGPSDRALPGSCRASQSEGEHPLPGEDPAGGHVRRPSRTSPSWHLALEALLTVARDWGTETAGGKRGFHREAGRAGELGDRAWHPGVVTLMDEPSTPLEEAHELNSSNQDHAPWEHLDSGLTQLGWLPTYSDVGRASCLRDPARVVFLLRDRLPAFKDAIRISQSNSSPRRFRPVKESGQQDGATANERLRTMTSAETAKQLGLLIHNPTTTMGLDNLPKQCGCTKHPYDPNLPEDGATHKPGDPCPFQKDNFPVGMFGTCCSLRGKAAARELEALGLPHLSARMHKDMSAEKAAEFSKELRIAVARLEVQYASKTERPRGAGWNGIMNAKTNGVEYQTYSTFEEALDVIREAARWYEKIAGLGFGVHAWY